MDRSRFLSALWRVLFYVLRPNQPFEMRTRQYRLLAVPNRSNLTRAVIRRGYWEPLATEVFTELLRPGSFVIDAGANFGHYALTAANIVGPNGFVVAFEPHAETYRLLSANAELQTVGNLECVNAGLGDTNGEITLYTDTENPGGHSFFEWNVRRSENSGHSVTVWALDNYLKDQAENRSVDVLKLDVQGFEMNVLNGARQTIETHKPAVLCEVTPDALRNAGTSHAELIQFFEEFNYRATIIDSTNDLLVAASFDELINKLNTTEAEYFDVLFQPEF